MRPPARSTFPGCRGYVVCAGGGTPHKPPPLSEAGYARWESTICAEYLLEQHGVSPDRVLKEWSSHDTVGNAYYVAAQHAVPRRWRTITVVTSEFHLPRSKVLHDWVYGLEGALGAAWVRVSVLELRHCCTYLSSIIASDSRPAL